MSATVTAVANEAPPPNPGKKKKLLLIGAAVLALALIGGGGAVWMIKSKAAAAAEEEDADGPPAAQSHAAAKHEDAKKSPPVYVPLEPFTVNLADKDSERFAQIAVTLEIDDAHFGDEIKQYMPAIRHNILMTLAQKTAAELLTREGKELLARQIRRDALRPMGIEVVEADAGNAEHGDEAAPKNKPRRSKAPASYPVRSVQFASFIIQ